MASEPLRHREIDRVQPELRNLVAMFDMDMSRLGAFAAEKEQPKPESFKDRRHRYQFIGSFVPTRQHRLLRTFFYCLVANSSWIRPLAKAKFRKHGEQGSSDGFEQ